MRNREHLDWLAREIDIVALEDLDHGTERCPERAFADVLERKIHSGVGRTAPRFHFLVDSVGQGIPRRAVALTLRFAVVLQEFLAVPVEQASSELDARGLPGGRIEPYHPRREMPIGVELQELEVDQPRACAQRDAHALPRKVVGRRGALEHFGHAAQREHDRRCLDDNRCR